ncbi:MAG: type II toxin-antitoxin system VapC family toxin [Phycicoccus sp.]
MAFGTVVDSNVLLDVLTDDPRWGDWSARHLAEAVEAGPVVVNPLVYAELSVGFDRVEDLDDALPGWLVREDLPWEAAFLAGRCFLEYRRAGGARRSPLLDFYVAAHAAVTGRTLLTRDRPRHLHVLPALRVIQPDAG